MKKTITFLGAMVALFSMSTVNAQYLPLKDFEDQSVTSGGWTVQLETGTTDWVTNDQGFGHGGTYYGMISNYDGTNNNASEAWLISPASNLTGATMPVLTFINAYNFAGDPLEVKISTDYTGSGSPTAATWTDLTPTLSTGSFDWVSSGNVDLSAYIGQTVYVAFKYTGTGSDGSKWEIDDITIDEPAVATPMSIYDIQYTTAQNGNSPEMGNAVSTGGIVTGIKVSGSAGYWIQDNAGAWNGIFVYDQSNTPAVGDSITFDADVDEFNGATQLENVTNFNIVSNGNTAYAPATVTVAQSQEEAYESVIVRLEGVICTNDNAGFGNWEVNDGTTTTLVGKYVYNVPNQDKVLGAAYNIQGITFVFDNGSGAPEYQTCPRNANDVELISGASIEENEISFDIYPNPANNNVNINTTVAANVDIISITGALVASQKVVSGNNTINIAALPAGVYFVKITSENKITTQKLVVQ